jgi:hypothetical protein
MIILGREFQHVSVYWCVSAAFPDFQASSPRRTDSFRLASTMAYTSSTDVDGSSVGRFILTSPPASVFFFFFYNTAIWHRLFFVALLSMGIAMLIMAIRGVFSLGLLLGMFVVGFAWAALAVLEYLRRNIPRQSFARAQSRELS